MFWKGATEYVYRNARLDSSNQNPDQIQNAIRRIARMTPIQSGHWRARTAKSSVAVPLPTVLWYTARTIWLTESAATRNVPRPPSVRLLRRAVSMPSTWSSRSDGGSSPPTVPGAELDPATLPFAAVLGIYTR